eukprot:scaffold625_cov324-Pavlova_lutheri.AAC.112
MEGFERTVPFDRKGWIDAHTHVRRVHVLRPTPAMRTGCVSLARPKAAQARRKEVKVRATGQGGPPDPKPSWKETEFATKFKEMFSPGSNKKIVYGVFQQDVDASNVPDEDERRKRIEKATQELTNIDLDERGRRMKVGQVGLASTVVLAAALLVTGVPNYWRAAIYFPLSLSLGFIDSGRTGL